MNAKTENTDTASTKKIELPENGRKTLTEQGLSLREVTAAPEPAPAPAQTPAAPVRPEHLDTLRERVLDAASDSISNTRQEQYGNPRPTFERVAALWTARELHTPGARTYTPEDVAAMLGLLKVARLAGNVDHADSYVDLVGYSAIGAELAGIALPE